MNITQILSDEHQVILGVITKALVECDAIETGKAVDVAFFTKTIDFIINYADKFHHAKEEDVLFKAMVDNSSRLHCNPIPVMLHEHDQGRHFVEGMAKALAAHNTGDLIANTRGYCFLLQHHIFKEDNVLYPMAEEALNDGQKEMVLLNYLEVEKKLKSEFDVERFLF